MYASRYLEDGFLRERVVELLWYIILRYGTACTSVVRAKVSSLWIVRQEDSMAKNIKGIQIKVGL